MLRHRLCKGLIAQPSLSQVVGNFVALHLTRIDLHEVSAFPLQFVDAVPRFVSGRVGSGSTG